VGKGGERLKAGNNSQSKETFCEFNPSKLQVAKKTKVWK